MVKSEARGRQKLPEFLRTEELRGVDLDSKQALMVERRILRKKNFLRKVYRKFYVILKTESIGVPSGYRVEVGSGPGFIKEMIPGTITSDVIMAEGIDRVFSAEKLPFEKNSVGCIYLVNVLHHMRMPERFLGECERCLKTGGRVIMIETANTPFSRFVYRNFHQEGFDENQKSWHNSHAKRLSDSNQAMAWMIFKRDRKKFEKMFPGLRIVKMKPHTPFTFVLSGGLTMKNLVPSVTYPVFAFLEKLFSPLNGAIGLFYTIVLEKV